MEINLKSMNNNINSSQLQNYDGYYKYDKNIAESYEIDRQNERHWNKEDYFLSNYLSNRKIEKLLDIPVGTGRFFKHYNKIETIIGIDISDEMIKKAKEKVSLLGSKSSINLEEGDVLNLRFQNSEFDSIVVFRLLHLMPEDAVKQAIEELCRVANKDIVVQTYVGLSGIRYLLYKIISKLNKYKSKDKIQEEKPWSHIQSYQHSQKLIDLEFEKHNFFPITRKSLDIYNNCDVRATIYSKKN
jgi:ubiquinone/menaquinone biosynthesis C-methylase UbiE